MSIKLFSCGNVFTMPLLVIPVMLTGCGTFMSLEQSEKDGQGRHIRDVNELRNNTAQSLVFWQLVDNEAVCARKDAKYCEKPDAESEKPKHGFSFPRDNPVGGNSWSKVLKDSYRQMLKSGISYHSRKTVAVNHAADIAATKVLWHGLQQLFVDCEVSGWNAFTGYVFAEFAEQPDHWYRTWVCSAPTDSTQKFRMRVLAAKSHSDANTIETDILFYLDDIADKEGAVAFLSQATRDFLRGDTEAWTELRTNKARDISPGEFSFRSLTLMQSSKKAGSDVWSIATEVSFN